MNCMANAKRWQDIDPRGTQKRADFPYAVAAAYFPAIKRILIKLNTGIEIAIAPEDYQTLEHAKTSELKKIEITPSGDALIFPKLNDGLYLPGLMQGLFGTKRWMAEKGKRAASAATRTRRAAA
jgi:hypothetical protein